jgi:DNA-binding NarL/FixJ family response regulator
MQIAHLAAEGLSNREIGQHLSLSHRTVGSHLYRIFWKLGISSGRELRLALADPPLLLVCRVAVPPLPLRNTSQRFRLLSIGRR